jgi:hypothetical protein
VGCHSDKNPLYTGDQFNCNFILGENINEKFLRFIGILFMGITAAVTLLSGVRHWKI